MSNKKLTTILRKYQKSPRKKGTFSAFEKKMLYRTTKTENPQTSMSMVEKVLKMFSAKTS
ncbi:MAG: hypothetical protein WCV59_01510 [Parcubacteria group bacterium]|jgi:hypothetical protein